MNLLSGRWRWPRDALRAFRRFWRGVGGRNTAEGKGRYLLRRWLSAEQRAQLDASGFFDVVGGATGKRYRIYYGVSANVEELDDAGHPRTGWCFAPQGYLAPGDVMLAQKVALETDELAALAVANQFLPGPLPRRAQNLLPI